MTPLQENTMHTTCQRLTARPVANQNGLSLIVVLLSLVTLAFASVALIRSIDTGSLVMGNLSFKKTATVTSDQAADAAITWIQSNLAGTKLYANDTDAGYSAASLPNLDVTGNSGDSTRPHIDWDGDGKCTSATCYAPKVITSTDADAFKHRYLITRMCLCAGDPNGTCASTSLSNSCSSPMTSSAGESPKKGELKYGDNVRFSGSGSPFYRVIVRTEGPRNTATVTETYVHF